jgi:hypothetical protein
MTPPMLLRACQFQQHLVRHKLIHYPENVMNLSTYYGCFLPIPRMTEVYVKIYVIDVKLTL